MRTRTGGRGYCNIGGGKIEKGRERSGVEKLMWRTEKRLREKGGFEEVGVVRKRQ